MIKKIVIFAILSHCLIVSLSAQSLRDNLQKYWYYRNRLLNNFVKVSANVNEAGTNIPVAEIKTTEDWLKMDDGNGMLNQYISVMASEYRLLKNYNQDYSQSIQLLYYALMSLNRLDATAESYYRQGISNANDLNGFIVRDDVTQTFWDKYRKGGTNQFFKVSIINTGGNNHLISPTYPKDNNYEMSEDNVIHYLEAMSLVAALVDDGETVDGSIVNCKQMAKDIAQRMVNYMYHTSDPHKENYCLDETHGHYCLPMWYSWYVKNPVTGNMVPQGSGTDDGTMFVISDGFAKSANRLLGTSSYQGIFPDMLPNILPVPLNDLQLNLRLKIYGCVYFPLVNDPIDPDIQLVLHGSNYDHTIVDLNLGDANWPSFCTDLVSTNLKTLLTIKEDDYKIRSLCTMGNISAFPLNTYLWMISKQIQNTVAKYEQFPLIWCVLNNTFSYISQDERDYIMSLLNSAPACGPYFNNQTDNGGDWSSDSRLIWPENLRGATDKSGNIINQGEFNGLDYMLLHNLYWLTTNQNSPPNFLDLQTNIVPPQNSYDFTATTALTCSQPIMLQPNSTVQLISGGYVELDPGFQLNGQGNFNIEIAEVTTKSEMLYFRKIDLTNYNANTCPDRLK